VKTREVLTGFVGIRRLHMTKQIAVGKMTTVTVVKFHPCRYASLQHSDMNEAQICLTLNHEEFLPDYVLG
jgi:hypothetical protein